MTNTLEEVCNQLGALADSVLSATAEDRTLLEVHGWNYPAVNRHDLAQIPRLLSRRLRQVNPETLDGEMEQKIKALQRTIPLIQSNIVPQLFNGNGATSAPAYVSGFSAIEKTLEPLLQWQEPNPDTLPPKLLRKLRAYNAQIDQIEVDKDSLQKQIKLINDATEAAESLPVDMQELEAARKRVEKAAASTEAFLAKVTSQEQESSKKLKLMDEKGKEAAALVASCEDAYRITTTKGLSAAFQRKATTLGISLWAWVLFLLIALVSGAVVAYHRIGVISSMLNMENPNVSVLWLQFALSALSVGAPLWFAWLATKQIGQRFRLSEDYAFKASVAKAYEGYRKEAARIDPELEKRLFSSAVDRLEEAPLRLVESNSHGGPWSEVLDSKVVVQALEKFPDLKEKARELGREALDRLAGARVGGSENGTS